MSKAEINIKTIETYYYLINNEFTAIKTANLSTWHKEWLTKKGNDYEETERLKFINEAKWNIFAYLKEINILNIKLKTNIHEN
jgi:hypothetical protein